MTLQTTTKWALRYYQGTDAPAGMTQQQDAMQDLDNKLPQSGTLANRATVVPSPRVGMFYYATDTAQLFFYDGSGWIDLGLNAPGIPLGGMLSYAGSGDPADTRFLLADGRALARTGQYANLFAAIGTTYGTGDGSTTFNIPDRRGRTSVGQDNMGTAQGAAGRLPNTNRVRGQTHGEERHTMTTAEVVAHTHGINDPGHAHSVADPAHNHNAPTGSSGFWAAKALGPYEVLTDAQGPGFGNADSMNPTGNSTTGVTVNGNFTGITTANVGSTTPFNVVQPGLVDNVLIRVK